MPGETREKERNKATNSMQYSANYCTSNIAMYHHVSIFHQTIASMSEFLWCVYLWAHSLQDKKDIEWACKAGVDWIAMSFVQKKGDMIELRDRVLALGFQESLGMSWRPIRYYNIFINFLCVVCDAPLNSITYDAWADLFEDAWGIHTELKPELKFKALGLVCCSTPQHFES